MYPKNAASPEPIAIGAVVQISDGAVQTSGCTVRIKPIGVAEGDGGGTTAYSTDGIVLYTPTQAETNYTSFILIAKKTGCIPASVTVVTTSSATPGTVLLAPVTHTSATVPTVTNVTTVNGLAAGVITTTSIADDAITAAKIANGAIDAASFAADVDAEILSYLVDDATRIDASALNTASGTSIPAILDDTGTAGVVVASGSKSGYSLTATTGLGNQTANITGTLSGNVGGIAGTIQTLDALDTAQDSQHTTTQGLVTTVDTVVDAIKVITDAITATGTGLSAIPWNASWDAEVQSEVNDALDTAISELSAGVPTATPTIRTAIMLLYMALRNRTTTTATAQTIQNDAGSTIATATLSDDGTTMTKAEFA